MINRHHDGTGGPNDQITLVGGTPGVGGAPEEYIAHHQQDPSGHVMFQVSFQTLQRHMGVTNELLLAILMHRLAGFQSGPFASTFNEDALLHLEEAMHYLKQRTIVRIQEGTYGRHMPDVKGKAIARFRVVNDILMIDCDLYGINIPLLLLRSKWSAWSDLERVIRSLPTPLTFEEWQLIESIPDGSSGINGLTELKQALARTYKVRSSG
jgi:hypothetical protein